MDTLSEAPTTATPSTSDLPEAGDHAAGACCHSGPGGIPARLSTPDLAWLEPLVRPLPPLRRHQRLFDAGETEGRLFVVRTGCLRVSVQQTNGDEQIMEFLLPGDLTGTGTGIQAFRGARAEALERSSVCVIKMSALRAMAARTAGLQEQLYTLIERVMAAERQHVLMMGRRGSVARVAFFLHTWARRRRAAGFPANDLHLPMRRREMANYLGLVTETASRAISRLQHDGVISVSERERIHVLQPERLASVAGVDAESD